MFHYINWKLHRYQNKIFIQNELFWVETQYSWIKNEWEFFLYPYYDENKRTTTYFAFDTIEQKISFEEILKVNWVWPKTAFQIAAMPREELKEAIKTLDTKFFQSIPWIWPKSAKKILIELKWTFELSDVAKMDVDQKLYKAIVSSMKWLWYEATAVKRVLQEYDWKITNENMTDVIKRVISKL